MTHEEFVCVVDVLLAFCSDHVVEAFSFGNLYRCERVATLVFIGNVFDEE